MDNIKKTVVIVLGISAILAMVVPSQVDQPVANPVAEGTPAPKAAPNGPVDGEPDDAPQPDEGPDADDAEFDDGEEFGGFGEPTIDGNPFDEYSSSPKSEDSGRSGEGGGGNSEPVTPLSENSVPAGAPPPRHATGPVPVPVQRR